MELESGPCEDGQRKRTRFTEEQILGVTREREAGAKAADLARKHGVWESTLYKGRAAYGGMDVSEAKRLNQRLPEAMGDASASIAR